MCPTKGAQKSINNIIGLLSQDPPLQSPQRFPVSGATLFSLLARTLEF